jgi:hypothetical protein
MLFYFVQVRPLRRCLQRFSYSPVFMGDRVCVPRQWGDVAQFLLVAVIARRPLIMSQTEDCSLVRAGDVYGAATTRVLHITSLCTGKLARAPALPAGRGVVVVLITSCFEGSCTIWIFPHSHHVVLGKGCLHLIYAGSEFIRNSLAASRSRRTRPNRAHTQYTAEA